MVVLLRKMKTSELVPIEEPIKDSLYFELKRLIEESGFMEPVLISEQGLIVDGCRRHAIAMEKVQEYIDCMVLQGEREREELLRLRAMLHCSRRPLCLNELQSLFVDAKPPCGRLERPTPRQVEKIIEDMFCARGIGPRILLEIAKKTPVVFITREEEPTEEFAELGDFVEDFDD